MSGSVLLEDLYLYFILHDLRKAAAEDAGQPPPRIVSLTHPQVRLALVLQALACADLSSPLTFRSAAFLEHALSALVEGGAFTSPAGWYSSWFEDSPLLSLEPPATALVRWLTLDWDGTSKQMERPQSWDALLRLLKFEIVPANGSTKFTRALGASITGEDGRAVFSAEDDAAVLAGARDALRDICLGRVRELAASAAREGAEGAARGARGAARSDDACFDELLIAETWDAAKMTAAPARVLDWTFALGGSHYAGVDMARAPAASRLMHVLGWRLKGAAGSPQGGGGGSSSGGGGGGGGAPRRLPVWPSEEWHVQRTPEGHLRVAEPAYRRAALEVLRTARRGTVRPAPALVDDYAVPVDLQERRYGQQGPMVDIDGRRMALRGVPVLVQEHPGPCALFSLINALLQRAYPPHTEGDGDDGAGEEERRRRGLALPVHHSEAAIAVVDLLVQRLVPARDAQGQTELRLKLSDVRDIFVEAIKVEAKERVKQVNMLVARGVKSSAAAEAVVREGSEMVAHAAAVAAHVVILNSGLSTTVPLGSARMAPWGEAARLFAYVRVPLLHGWLPPPDSREAAILARMPGLTNEAVDTPDANPPEGLSAAEWEALARYVLAPPPKDVYAVTPAGVAAIAEALEPGEFGVLYGGDHYSTVFKFPRPRPSDGAHSLYRLVYEGGLDARAEGLAVWERFEVELGPPARVHLVKFSARFFPTEQEYEQALLQQLGAAPGGGGGGGADAGME